MLAGVDEQGAGGNVEASGKRAESQSLPIEREWGASHHHCNSCRRERTDTGDGCDPGGRAVRLVNDVRAIVRTELPRLHDIREEVVAGRGQLA